MKWLLICVGVTVASVVAGDLKAEVEGNPQIANFRRLFRSFHETQGNVEKEEASVGAVPSCSNNTLSGCLQSYTSTLGLPFPLPSSQVYLNTLTKNFYNTIGGYLTVCRTTSTLQQCLGTQWANCLGNRINMINVLGLGNIEAATYTSIFYTQAWNCGPGLDVTLNNYACMGQVWVQQNATIQGCLNTFRQQTQEHPDMLCKWYQALTACAAFPFHSACGVSTSYAVCESWRVGAVAANPQCFSIYCPSVNQ